MGKFRFQAERAAYSVLADQVIKFVAKNPDEYLLKLADLTEGFAKDRFRPEEYASARSMIRNPKGKWMNFTKKVIQDIDPHVLKTTGINLGFNAMLSGMKMLQESKSKHQCNIPWLILLDPTSACNLHCTGCWAAEYGHTQSMSYEDLDKIITQGKELGIYLYLMTGGEPLVRKDDIIKLCIKHNDCQFHVFTNGTLIDEKFCKKMLEVGNISLSLSLEGFQEVNDARRGEGCFEKVMQAMELLKQYGLIYGASICYTSANVGVVASDAFLDMIIEKGCKYASYFHYMPVGNDADITLLPNVEQREYMYHRVRELRSSDNEKQIFVFDFQNDGQYVDGCVAGGRYYCHINPNGDVEPCVFIHYSNANIHEVDLIDAFKQPLFMEYKKGYPFSNNHLCPCPMLENPSKLQAMVDRSGAKSTDMKSPEDVHHLCAKCTEYAKKWQPRASELWIENRHEYDLNNK